MNDSDIAKTVSNYDSLCTNLTFNEDKAIGVLSYLCSLADNKLNHYKAAKLMYLFDREMLLETGEPAFYGQFFSLPKGPIVSEVNNGIKSCLGDELDTFFNWKEYFHLDEKSHQLSQRDPNTIAFSGLLSDEERTRLAKLYRKYENYSFSAMLDVMHSLPENIELKNNEKRKPLSYHHVLKQNGFTDQQIHELLVEISYENSFRNTISSI
ncbi:MAG: SocA family protein [Chloroflexi bacterium]|nr:SocA family protein [Chloroflexota bacterium]